LPSARGWPPAWNARVPLPPGVQDGVFRLAVHSGWNKAMVLPSGSLNQAERPMPGEVTMWLTVLSAFPALAPQQHGAHTVLTGLLDRSALYGVLAEIEGLGLDLLEIRRLTPDRTSPEPGDRRSP
jgi:hypothetical protein